jgi:Fuc2NAc and GlcNAc transferase
MSVGAVMVVVGAWALSYVLVGAIRRIAIKQNIIDVPNERSSHAVATPRGGGVGIVVSFVAATSALWAIDLISSKIWLALVLSGGAIAGVGYLDDRQHLSAARRILVHVGAAVFFVAAAGGYPAPEVIKWGLRGVWAGSAFSVLALVWGTNLFNFMDGIDGIAAGESIFITVSAGTLNLMNGGDSGLTAVLFSLSAASLGFLFWNWPPARIFMGDVGSGFLGFIISACLMATSIQGALPIEVLPILGGVFFVDATTTLMRRILQGDRWLEPHRTHAYQRMARRFGRHLPVTIIIFVVNVVWLLPWAVATIRFPENGRVYMAAALLPLVIISIVVGAGRREEKSTA